MRELHGRAGDLNLGLRSALPRVLLRLNTQLFLLSSPALLCLSLKNAITSRQPDKFVVTDLLT